MEVFECLKERRSTRSFLNKPVEREKLERIIEAGTLAPSGMNEQACMFTAVSDREALGRLNLAVHGITSADTEKRIRSRSKNNTFCFYYNAPTLIIVTCGPEAMFPREDAACALENMFLAAHALGLGSCWINQLCGGGDNSIVRSVLDTFGIPQNHRVYGCAAIGYIDTPTELKPRKSVVKYF